MVKKTIDFVDYKKLSNLSYSKLKFLKETWTGYLKTSNTDFQLIKDYFEDAEVRSKILSKEEGFIDGYVKPYTTSSMIDNITEHVYAIKDWEFDNDGGKLANLLSCAEKGLKICAWTGAFVSNVNVAASVIYYFWGGEKIKLSKKAKKAIEKAYEKAEENILSAETMKKLTDLEDELQKVREQADQDLQEERERHNQELKNQQIKHNELLTKLRKQLQEEIDKQDVKVAEKCAKMKEDLKKEYDDAIKILQDTHTNEINELKQQMSEDKAEYERRNGQQQLAHQKQMMELEHKFELQRVNDKQTIEQQKKVIERQRKEIAELKSKIDKMQATMDAQSSELKEIKEKLSGMDDIKQELFEMKQFFGEFTKMNIANIRRAMRENPLD